MEKIIPSSSLLVPEIIQIHMHQCKECGCTYNCSVLHVAPFFGGPCNQCIDFPFRNRDGD